MSSVGGRGRLAGAGCAIGLLAAITLVTAAPPAHACSCSAPDHERQLEATDLAFIGTVTDIGPDVTREGHGFLDQVHGITFSVEQSLKGDVAGQIELLEPSTGAGCSSGLGVGARAAVYTYREGDDLATGMCSLGDADSVLAEMRPIGRQSTAPARYLVVGAGAAMLTLLDADGAITGVVEAARTDDEQPSTGTRYRRPEQVDLCPDGVHLVEQYADEVLVRDLASLEVVTRTARPPLTSEYRCADAAGDLVVGIGGNAVHLLGARTGAIDLGAPVWELLGIDRGGRAIATVGEEVAAIDIATGERTSLYRLDASGGPPTDTALPQHAGRIMSPDRTRLLLSWRAMRNDDSHLLDAALAVVALDDPGVVVQTVVGVDSRVPTGNVYDARAYWLDADRVALPSDDGAYTQIYSARDLTQVAALEPVGYTALTADPSDPGTAVTFAGGRFVTIDLATGEAQQRNTLVLPGAPMVLPTPIDITAELPDIGPPPPPVPLDRAAAIGAPRPTFAATTGRPWLVPAIVAGLLMAGAAVVAGLLARRRHHDAQ